MRNEFGYLITNFSAIPPSSGEMIPISISSDESSEEDSIIRSMARPRASNRALHFPTKIVQLGDSRREEQSNQNRAQMIFKAKASRERFEKSVYGHFHSISYITTLNPFVLVTSILKQQTNYNKQQQHLDI